MVLIVGNNGLAKNMRNVHLKKLQECQIVQVLRKLKIIFLKMWIFFVILFNFFKELLYLKYVRFYLELKIKKPCHFLIIGKTGNRAFCCSFLRHGL